MISLAPLLTMDPHVFAPDETDELVAHIKEFGYAILRGAFDDSQMNAIQTECEHQQDLVVQGSLPERHGTVILDSPEAMIGGQPFAHYVCHITECSSMVDGAVHHPGIVSAMNRYLGDDCWLLDDERFGVVYQDARPGKESAYTRIGWHSDWQSGPQLRCWPSLAFTIHVDETSPANGFLRVVPGSHLWATPAPAADIYGKAAPVAPGTVGGWTDITPPYAMPSGFQKVPGEIAVYAERGDVIFHDAYLWHSAARATDDDAVRRHIRGGWFTNERVDLGLEHFVKNAAR